MMCIMGLYSTCTLSLSFNEYLLVRNVLKDTGSLFYSRAGQYIFMSIFITPLFGIPVSDWPVVAIATSGQIFPCNDS